jgi:DNA-binding CsgD family transcriptional regulator
MTACSFITAATYLLVTRLPLPFQQSITVLLPLACALLLLNAMQKPNTTPEILVQLSDARHIFSLDLLLLVVMVGFSFGMIRSMALGHLTSSMTQLTLATVIGIALASILLLITAMVFKKSNHLYLMSQISFPLLAAGFLLIPLVATSFPWPTVIFTVGHNYFYSLLWVLYVDQIRQTGRSAASVFAIGQFAFLGSSLLGIITGEILALATNFSNQAMTIASSIMVYLIILGLVLMLRRSRAQKPLASVEAKALQTEAIESLSVRFGLTPREKDILALIAESRDRTEIGERLFLSINTVKSYAAHLYDKLGIHSKREVIKLVEVECEHIRRES